MHYSKRQSLRRDERAVTPAISTVILTSAVVVMILLAMSFANNMLGSRLAENEYSTNKQFMLTTGLQVDDVAWTIGRTQTVRFSSEYGNLQFQKSTIRYTIQVDNGSGVLKTLFQQETGIILFNIPVSSYSMGNNYFERISPSSSGSFLQLGPSAPATHVFCAEKLPMAGGSYTRIVVAPSIRMLNSTITGPQQSSINYFKLYMPLLQNGTHLYRSQSVTLSGDGITKVIESGVKQIRITATFPNNSAGFDNSLFHFASESETINLPAGSIVEFYLGKVLVTIGQV